MKKDFFGHGGRSQLRSHESLLLEVHRQLAILGETLVEALLGFRVRHQQLQQLLVIFYLLLLLLLERISHPFDIGTARTANHLRSRHEVRADGDLAVPARTLVSHPVRCTIVIAADHVAQLLCLLRASQGLRIISFYLALRRFRILIVDFLAD